MRAHSILIAPSLICTDWIYYHGYHGSQMGPLFASAEAMMWQSPDGEFSAAASADETFHAYARQTYGPDDLMVAYWHLAGSRNESVLCDLQSGEMNGSILRRSAYLEILRLGSLSVMLICLDTMHLLHSVRHPTVSRFCGLPSKKKHAIRPICLMSVVR